jgi:hypothetical protein
MNLPGSRKRIQIRLSQYERHNPAHLCIDVNRCFPSMQVRNSDPSSDEDTAKLGQMSLYVTGSFVDARTEDDRWNVIIA